MAGLSTWSLLASPMHGNTHLQCLLFINCWLHCKSVAVGKCFVVASKNCFVAAQHAGSASLILLALLGCWLLLAVWNGVAVGFKSTFTSVLGYVSPFLALKC
jgi:hypothetical protein